MLCSCRQILHTLLEKCPNTEFFLVCIFPYSDRYREYGKIRTRKNSVFGHFSRVDGWRGNFLKLQTDWYIPEGSTGNTPLGLTYFRDSPAEVFLGKSVLKICSKFTGKHPCQSVIWIKSLCNFIEIALWHGYSPVNLLHIFRTPFHLAYSWTALFLYYLKTSENL